MLNMQRKVGNGSKSEGKRGSKGVWIKCAEKSSAGKSRSHQIGEIEHTTGGTGSHMVWKPNATSKAFIDPIQNTILRHIDEKV